MDVLISVPELAAALQGPHPPRILDVRWSLGGPDGRLLYREGHIPTAVYVDLDTELAAPAEPLKGRHPLPDERDLTASARRWGVRDGEAVVVYDDVAGTSAARAWWLLRHGGIADVRILDGALAAWLNAGRPLETGDATAGPGDVTLRYGGMRTVGMAEARVFPDHGVLLDARAGERYRGESEPVDPRPGHIPGAVSAPTAQNVGPDGRFLTAEELRGRFAGLGAMPGRNVAVYCGSGVTAAHEIAALAVAGIDADLYPGSYSQWSSHPQLPVTTGPEPGNVAQIGDSM